MLALIPPALRWPLAFTVSMTAASIGAAVAGTRMALRASTPLIRKPFLALLAIFIARMAWDTLGRV